MLSLANTFRDRGSDAYFAGMYSRFLSLKTGSGNPLSLTAKASGNEMCFRSVLVRFCSDKRMTSY